MICWHRNTSGPTATEAGALVELTSGGTQPVTLPSGETRSFLKTVTALH